MMPSVQKQVVKPVTKKTTGGVLSRVAPIEFDPDEGISLNLYGRSGTGKTTLAGTFPGPILWILCSGGINPGELRSLNTPQLRKQISQVTLWQSTEIADLVGDQIARQHYNTVVLDHCSGLQDLILKEILGIDEIPAQKSWGLASQQQYGQVAMQCKTLLRLLLNLKCNRVFIAQERNFGESEDENEVVQPYISSALSPSIAGWLAPACDYVCQTYIRAAYKEVSTTVNGKVIKSKKKTGGVEFCLRTAVHESYASKFRVPKGTPLPECIVDPSYDKIIKLINGGK